MRHTDCMATNPFPYGTVVQTTLRTHGAEQYIEGRKHRTLQDAREYCVDMAADGHNMIIVQLTPWKVVDQYESTHDGGL